MDEKYTPGHTRTSVNFMSNRTLASHGAFFLPFLADGMAILDCGCGPGTISCDIAEYIPLGRVVGMDKDESQVRLAAANAAARNIENVEFRTVDSYDLLFDSESFDAALAHALLEHLRDPTRALGELFRVLRPGGTLGVCSPDWGGFLLSPPSVGLTAAVDAYTSLQIANGGDPHVGRMLAPLLREAGFERISITARYEVYGSLASIGDYLADQLDDAGDTSNATTFRAWSKEPSGMFVQAWVSCTGHKPRL